MAKNILVTGGAGYIGSHTAKALSRAGYRPVTYDSLVYGHRHAVKWGPFVEGDIADTAKLERVIKDEAIDAIVHFAAFAYVGESVTKPEIYFQNNVVGSLSLLDAMRHTNVKPIVFSSTCATYGMPDRMPITEDTAQKPINPYGETKLMIERALAWYGPAHDIRSVSLRYFNACGADPEGEIGEEHDPETHLIPLILDAALGKRAAIDVFGTDYPTPDGTAVRDYIHVQDLAEAHVKALGYLFEGGATTQVNLGTGTGSSVREVIDAVERVTGRSVPKREVARRAGDPPELVADPSKANSLLGWKPTMSDIDSIIRTAWAWHTRAV